MRSLRKRFDEKLAKQLGIGARDQAIRRYLEDAVVKIGTTGDVLERLAALAP